MTNTSTCRVFSCLFALSLVWATACGSDDSGSGDGNGEGESGGETLNPVDSDGDGLTDDVEALLNTDPNLTDSDGDTISAVRLDSFR